MAATSSSNKNVSEEAGSGALDIKLHPLVIINISDHFTRAKVRSHATRVFGAMIGTQEGRSIEIFNSFELVCTAVGEDLVFDTEYLTKKAEAMKQVFPNYDILGWYSTGKRVSDVDIKLQRQFEPFNESPLYLLLDADPDPTVREIPIAIYESEVKIINDNPTLLFAKSNYRIDTGDAERLAVDHVARVSGGVGGQEESMLTSHLASMHSAIKMLRMRVNIVKEFLLEQQKQGQNVDLAILRRISSLCHMLPAIDSPQFRQEFLNEYSDALLVAYLSSIMKASNAINELVDKFNLAFDKHSQRRRGF